MSTTHRINLQPAYLLHQRPYRDTSALLDMISRDYGRISLVARGIKTSRLRGALQAFRPLLVSWVGRTELVTLTGCESGGAARRLAGRVLLSGFYLNELLIRLLHRHDPHPRLFDIYADTLKKMEDPAEEERALRIFEKYLLQEIGYALILDHRADTGVAVEPDRLYSYRLEQGPLSYDETLPRAITVHGRSLLALANEQLNDAQSLREIKHLMRAALGLYLGDKPLHSRKLVADFQQTASPLRRANREQISEAIPP